MQVLGMFGQCLTSKIGMYHGIECHSPYGSKYIVKKGLVPVCDSVERVKESDRQGRRGYQHQWERKAEHALIFGTFTPVPADSQPQGDRRAAAQ